MGINGQDTPVRVRLGHWHIGPESGSGDADVYMNGHSLLPHINGEHPGRGYTQ